jgi:putative flippase GtrA
MVNSFVRDLLKYVLVAVCALVVDLGSLLVLHRLSVQYLVAATTGFVLGTIVNFILSRGFVFSDPVIKNKIANFMVYAAIGVLGLLCNNVIIWLCFSKLGLTLTVSKLVAVAVVFMWNFLARRQFLFRGHKVPVEREVSFEG